MNELPDQFDRFINERFSEFQLDPPEGVWNNVHADIKENAKSRSRRRLALFLLPAAASIMVVVTGVFLGLGLRYTSSEVNARLAAQRQQIQLRNAVGFNSTSPDSGDLADQQNSVVQQNTQLPENPQKQYVTNNPQKNDILPDLQVLNSEEDGSIANALPYNLEIQNKVAVEGSTPDVQNNSIANSNAPLAVRSALSHVSNKSIKEIAFNICNNLSSQNSAMSERLATRHDYTRTPDIFIGLKYTPQYRIGIDDKTALSHGFALDLGMQESRIIVQTGIGVEFVKQNTDYLLSWNQQQTTGSFQQVSYYTIDSIPLFNGDTLVGYIFRPLFHTENTEIFDTVLVEHQATAAVNYTYMNIPLMLGYRWNCHNWAFNLKAGGSYTFQTGKLRTPENLDEIVANVTEYSATRISPERRKQWFSLIALPEVEYYFTEKLSANIEPWVRYTLSNTSGNLAGEVPYAVGVNAGLKIHL